MLAFLREHLNEIKDHLLEFSGGVIFIAILSLSILGFINILIDLHILTPSEPSINVAAGYWAIAIGITILFAVFAIAFGSASLMLLEYSWTLVRDVTSQPGYSSRSPELLSRLLLFVVVLTFNLALLAGGFFFLVFVLCLGIWPVYFDSELRHALHLDDIYHFSPSSMRVVSEIVFLVALPLFAIIILLLILGLPEGLIRLVSAIAAAPYRRLRARTARPESVPETREENIASSTSDLRVVTASLINAKSFGNIYSAGAYIFTEYAESQESSATLAGCVFWQIAMRSPVFRKTVLKLGIWPWRRQYIEPFVVMRGEFDHGRYDLALLEPKRRGDPAAFDAFPLSDRDLAAGVERWLGDYGNTEIGSIVHSNGMEPWRSMRDNVPFGLMAIRRPKLQRSASLQTPIPVALAHDRALIASAGLLAMDSEDRMGITTARHAVVEADRLRRGRKRSVKKIGLLIGEMPGEVVDEDIISDSVFVIFKHRADERWPIGHTGALQKVSPRQHEKVTFSGAITPAGVAEIFAMSPDIPHVRPLSQLKVLTNPVTSPGDSGAAMLDSDRKIVGFAFERTAPGVASGYSSWIWADSVLQALKLRLT